MVRDGVIASYDGDRPKSHYYAVIGSIRVTKPLLETDGYVQPRPPATIAYNTPDLNSFIAEMKKLGVKFTITITNEGAK